MKAIQIHKFGGPEVLVLESVSELSPGPGSVVVHLNSIGVNPVDTYIRNGVYGDRSFPFTPGFDAAGIVAKVGAGVSRVKMNDRVYVAGSVSGTYADETLCKESQVHPLPSGISFDQGAALGVPYATAHYALFNRGQAQRGEVLFVHGASGSVGIAAVQMAKSAGLTVIGTAGTLKGRELVAQEGAKHVLDHTAAHYLDQVMELTNRQGVAIVLEMLANVNLAKDLKILAAHGRVVVIGSRGKVEIDPRDTMVRNADIRGMSLFYAGEDELVNVHAALVAGLERGSLRPVIAQKLPLAQAARAQEEVLNSGTNGKIVLNP
jgi:NADPH2:quinone reductase